MIVLRYVMVGPNLITHIGTEMTGEAALTRQSVFGG